MKNNIFLIVMCFILAGSINIFSQLQPGMEALPSEKYAEETGIKLAETSVNTTASDEWTDPWGPDPEDDPATGAEADLSNGLLVLLLFALIFLIVKTIKKRKEAISTSKDGLDNLLNKKPEEL